MKKQWKGRLLTALLCNLFLFGTVMVFSPLEVYIGSFVDFHFGFGVAWKIMVLAMLAVTAAVTAVEMLLPKRMALLLHALTVGIGLCCYVQMMFLNGKMVTLTGAGMITTRAERIANLGVWAAMMAAAAGAAFFALHKKKDGLLHDVLRYVSALLTVMQTVGLLTAALTTDMSSAGGFMLTGDGRFEMAPENNTLVFVFDATENTIFEDVLRDYPDVYEALSGFTYYPDAISTYSRTYPSLTYMITGGKCYYDKPHDAYISDAYTQSALLGDLKAAEIDSRAFSLDINKFSKAAEPFLGNMFITNFDSLDSVSVPDLIGGMLNISLYKTAPYRLKYELVYSMDKINQRVIRHDKEQYQHYDYEYYHDLKEHGLKVNSEYAGAFRFYHLFGSHHDLYWDENMVRIDVTNKVQPLRGSLRIIEEFVRMLEEEGILDQTTIIVTADHGAVSGGGHTDLRKNTSTPPTPIMLVKYPDSDMSRPLTISKAPITHDDLFATVIEGCGMDPTAYGRTIREIPENEQRERYYYYTAFSDRDGGEMVLREYLIEGDARDFKNWTDTGRYWDILYSPYEVSKYRYMEENQSAAQ